MYALYGIDTPFYPNCVIHASCHPCPTASDYTEMMSLRMASCYKVILFVVICSRHILPFRI